MSSKCARPDGSMSGGGTGAARTQPRIFPSPLHIGESEERFVDACETEFADLVGSSHAAALSAGTAAIRISLVLAGVGKDDGLPVSSLAFSASVNPSLYVGAWPVVDGTLKRRRATDTDGAGGSRQPARDGATIS